MLVNQLDVKKHICYSKNIMLIEILKQLQVRDNLSDQEFAEKIGIHRVSWNRIKRGTIFGKKFLSGVRQAYPELKDDIDIFLAGSVQGGNLNVLTDTTAPTETHQNKGQGSLLKRLVVRVLQRIKGG